MQPKWPIFWVQSNFWVQTGQAGPQDPKMGIMWSSWPQKRILGLRFFLVHLPLCSGTRIARLSNTNHLILTTMFCSTHTVTFTSYNNSISVVTKSVILSTSQAKKIYQGKIRMFPLVAGKRIYWWRAEKIWKLLWIDCRTI